MTDDYLKALALWTMAHSSYKEAMRFEAALAKFLKYDGVYMGHLSDALMEETGDFDAALKQETARSGYSLPHKPRMQADDG